MRPACWGSEHCVTDMIVPLKFRTGSADTWFVTAGFACLPIWPLVFTLAFQGFGLGGPWRIPKGVFPPKHLQSPLSRKSLRGLFFWRGREEIERFGLGSGSHLTLTRNSPFPILLRQNIYPNSLLLYYWIAPREHFQQ